MLQKLSSVIILFAVATVASIIISIVPISYLENIISRQLETISVKITRSDVWNFRLFSITAYTSYATFETTFDKYGAKAKFYVEGLSYRLISGNNYCNKVIANIYIDDPNLIKDVILDALGDRGIAPEAVDLCPAGNPRANEMLKHITGNLFPELFHKLRAFRPGADHTHVTLQYVKELWEFIQ